MAEVLGLPHSTIIMQVEKQDGGIRVKRELEDGWFQHVDIPLPDSYDSIGHQQAAVRDPDGHQESEDQSG